MKSKLIKVGNSVVFSQSYLFHELAPSSAGTVGTVIKIDETHASVEFERTPKATTVLLDELELYDPSSPTFLDRNDTIDYDTIQAAENHEFGGYSRSQLIALKLTAQEADPVADKVLSRLINAC